MPTIHVRDADLYYACDDYTEPWSESETILMLHGNAESSAVWFGWVPELAGRYRLIRPDMRGFGESAPMPREYPWTLDGIVDDYVALMSELGIGRFHVIGAKLGGTVARRLAARRPELVQTLTVAGTPPPRRDHVQALVPGWMREFEDHGVAHWARRTMAGRLGADFPEAGVEWWIALMGRTPLSTQLGFMAKIPMTDISADLPRIQCPTLVITTEGSALGSVEETRRWQETIPDSRLVVLPGDSYHVAASHARRCAQETFAFISGETSSAARGR